MIKPGSEGGYLVYSRESRKSFSDLKTAVDYAEKQSRNRAIEEAEAAGAEEIETKVDVTRKKDW